MPLGTDTGKEEVRRVEAKKSSLISKTGSKIKTVCILALNPNGSCGIHSILFTVEQVKGREHLIVLFSNLSTSTGNVDHNDHIWKEKKKKKDSVATTIHDLHNGTIFLIKSSQHDSQILSQCALGQIILETIRYQ